MKIASGSSKVFQFFDGDILERSLRERGHKLPWKKFVMIILGFLPKQSELRLISMGLLIVGFIWMVDWKTSPQNLTMFYLVPIMLVTWFGGKTLGVAVSIAASIFTMEPINLTTDKFYSISAALCNEVNLNLVFFLVIVFILSLLKISSKREKYFARIDFLTEIPNRRFFMEEAEREIVRARRYKHPFTVIYLDVDNLKLINDQFGHSEGDKLLQSLAQGLRSKTRATDVIARLGGDEFVILLPETDSGQAEFIVHRIQNISADFRQQNKEWPMQFSMGVVTFSTPPTSVDEILNISDKAMYSAKRKGKNHVCREKFLNGLELKRCD